MSGLISTLLLVGAVYVAWQTATGKMPEVENIIKDILGQLGLQGGLQPAPSPIIGGGAAPSSGTMSPVSTCPGGTSCGPCRSQSGGQRCECNNYKGSAYEATFCGTWSGDDLSIKMWGPTHSGSNCCWCILNTSPSGQMRMRGEGPHPTTKDLGVTGSVGGKPTCVKAVIRPGPKGAHVEGWGFVNGAWKKGLTYDGPCGLGSNVLTKGAHANQQVSFRVDGQMKATCTTVKPLSGASYTNAYFTHDHYYYTP